MFWMTNKKRSDIEVTWIINEGGMASGRVDVQKRGCGNPTSGMTDRRGLLVDVRNDQQNWV